MQVIYKISDRGFPKNKPLWFNKINCLRNALNCFRSSEFFILMDNVSSETKDVILEFYKGEYQESSIGNPAGTFLVQLDKALQLDDKEIVYFLEDDYLHKEGSENILIDGFELDFDYVTLYDHPDKYLNPFEGGNPFCSGRSEQTRVFLGKYCHFKLTNSTTGTFAAKVRTLKEDEAIIRKWFSGTYGYDFNMFQELLFKGRRLASPIPGYSTHCEVEWLTPLTDWSKI